MPLHRIQSFAAAHLLLGVLTACSTAPSPTDSKSAPAAPPTPNIPESDSPAPGESPPDIDPPSTHSSESPELTNCVTAAEGSFTPYLGPYLTLLSPTAAMFDGEVRALDPSSSIVINFEQEAEREWTPQVCYRAQGSAAWRIANGISNQSMHHIEIEGLASDQSFEYRLLDPNLNSSETFRFSTVAPGSDRIRFLVIGDMQDEEEKQRWRDVAQEIAANHIDEFDFIVSVGDMVADDWEFEGDRFHFWKVFFDRGRELLSQKPMFATPGNHDTPAYPWSSEQPETYWSNAADTESYRKYFSMPQKTSFTDSYAFDFGAARFISINSEVPVFFGRNPELDQHGRVQGLFDLIESETSSTSTSDWLFAFSHVPPVNPSGGKDEVQYVRPYTDLFTGKVDWFFSGHTHQNQRLHPADVRSTSHETRPRYGKAEGEGTGYLIVPPAGQYPRAIEDWTGQLAFSPHHEGTATYEIGFVLVEVNQDHFWMRTYGMGDVDGRNPNGYFDDGSSRLLDEVKYWRQ